MNEPLVSIVTPSYNQGEFLEDTILSVKNQTYPKVEHLVIDGGSDDNTVDILERYEDQYQLQWVSEPDEGQSDAINKGYNKAKGDIVAWLNSDDVYFDTGVLRRVVQYFDKYSEDILYGDLVHIDENSTIQAVDPHPRFDKSKLFYRVLLGQPATFFRKEVIKTNPVRTDLHYCMDHEYWLRLSQHYNFRHISDIFSGFRVYPDQKSQNQEASSEEFRRVASDYDFPEQNSFKVAVNNAYTELRRWVRSLYLIRQLRRNPPELAFDGSVGSTGSMLFNIFPDLTDLISVWRRFRTDGQI